MRPDTGTQSPIESAYTDEFFTITRKGHDRTTQSFGSPTLIWHISIWPRNPETQGELKEQRSVGIDYHNSNLSRIQEHLNGVVKKLQVLGRYQPLSGAVPDGFECEPDPDTDLNHFQKESVNFTLWWSDQHTEPINRTGKRSAPAPEDLRVRVQVEVYPDYASISFFLDVSKCWSVAKPVTADSATGIRRQAIFRHTERVKTLCERRIQEGQTGIDPLLESGVNDDERRDLLAAARYLYSDQSSDDAGTVGIWEEFCQAFNVHLTELAGKDFEVFVNLRGLVLPTPGRQLAQSAPPAGGGKLFERFQPEDPAKSTSDEPNAIVHGYWPFIRRSRSEADYRDWIACGVLGWRAIFISSLGAQSQYADGDEEASAELPCELPARLTTGTSQVPGKDLPAPFRYLLLTKGEPDRKQIGRMVDRINSLSTLQLYSFKNWSVLRNANVLIRDYGRRLDNALTSWVRDFNDTFTCHQEAIHTTIRDQIRERFAAWNPSNPLVQLQIPTELLKVPIMSGGDESIESTQRFLDHMRALDQLCENVERAKLTAQSSNVHALDRLLGLSTSAWLELRRLKSRRDEDLSQVNQQAERQLIAISRLLDDLGRRAVGGIQYRINRSRYYAETYRKLLESMRCGNIETWWTYDQFANRSVDPVFRLIDGIGQRLEKLRERLRSTMESVQTSAIVNQTEATRDNTYQMENIVRNLERLSETGVKLLDEAEHARKRAVRWGYAFTIIGGLWAILGGVALVEKLRVAILGW
jgi:hypothetical protein